MRPIIACVILGLLTTVDVVSAQKGGTPIKPTQTWSGTIADDEAAKLAPKIGFLIHQKAFEELWTGWKLKDKAPTINFEKQIVVVTLAIGGPNVPRASFTRNDKGDVKVLALSTLIGGPGFGYSIDVLNREGIKTIQGKAISIPQN